MTSIIVAAPPIPGETAPVVQLAAELVRRGHRVTALLGTGFQAQASAAGARFVALPGAADFDIAEVSARPDRLALPPGPEQLNWDHIEIFLRAIPDQHQALQDLLEQDPEACLVCNSVFFGAWPVALGAPGRRPARWVAVAPNPLVLADDLTTPFGPTPGLDGDEQVAANRAVNDQFEAAMAPAKQAAQEIVDGLGADRPMPPYVDSLYTMPDGFVALSVAELDFPRANLPATVRFGGLLPTPAGRSDQGVTDWPSWWAELDEGRPVLVVTQGTVANSDLSELIEPTLLALAETDALVVAALGREPSGLGIDIPANARVEGWIPFAELLPRADLLITNGGFGGVQTALAHGVPVVVAGTSEDKPMVAAHVAFAGVGLDLQTQRPTAEQLREAVRSVLDDPAFAEAATRLKQAYDRSDPVATIEELLS